MEESIDLSVALSILHAKIAELNYSIIKEKNTEEAKSRLKNALMIKQKLSEGDMKLAKKIVDGEIKL